MDYSTPTGWFSEWICLEHTGFAQKTAGWWWTKRFGWPIPKTVDSALAIPDLADNIFRMTAAIKVDRVGEFPKIVGYTMRPQPVTT